MRKNKLLQVRVTIDEYDLLENLSQQTCLSKSSLVRMLIKGYKPKAKLDDDFYKLMKEMYIIGKNIDQLLVKAYSLNFIDVPKLEAIGNRHKKLVLNVEQKYIKPDKDIEIYGS